MPTVRDIPIGGKIKFGAYSVGKEEPHKIRWLKAHPDCTLISAQIVDIIVYDWRERLNMKTNRAAHGCNRYSLSNVNQFLNSSANLWFSPTTEDDAVLPNMYKPGFLKYFEPWEIDAIEASTIITALPKCDIGDGKKYEVFDAKVFLPSTTNIKGRIENGVHEGPLWALFAGGTDPKCNMSPEYEEYGEINLYGYESDGWFYNLRTPVTGNECACYYIDQNGSQCMGYCDDQEQGLRPCLKLDPDMEVSEEPDEEGYYEVIETANVLIEIDEQEFLDILSK